MRPEVELLFLLARTHVTPETAARVGTLLGRGVDWFSLMREAVSHDVLPLVYSQLRTVGRGAVPDAILDELARYFDHHVRRNRRLAEELRRLLAALDARAIPTLAFKGPTLAAAAYGDLALRSFCDVDFLIRRRDALLAKAVFLDAGYALETPLDRRGFPVERGKSEYAFAHESDGSIAELRWRLTPPDMRVSFDFEYLEGRHRSVTVDGTPVPTLTAEDTLLLLCVHANQHYWGGLKWICDVAELIRATPGMDWRRVAAGARRLGSRRMVALGLRLALDYLDAPLPGEMADALRKDARATRLASAVSRDLLTEEPRLSIGRHEFTPPYHAHEVLERFPEWSLAFARRALTLSPHDTRFVHLPQSMRVVYYPLRGARLLVKFGLRPLTSRSRGGGIAR